jgi:hypothetical protein
MKTSRLGVGSGVRRQGGFRPRPDRRQKKAEKKLEEGG